MVILGINSYHPDSAAAVIIDGRLIAACEEERYRRIKHFSGFPLESIRYCLKEADISIKDIDYIAIPRRRSARFGRKVFYGARIPALAWRRLSVWKKMARTKETIAQFFDVPPKEIRAKLIGVEHHLAHLASSFFVSGFEKAFLLSTDALGDFASTMWAVGEGSEIRPLGEIRFPHSLGFYYTAITQYLGFLNFGDEYKVMGLAAYGKGAFEDEFKKILRIKKNGFELGLEYFNHHKRYINMEFDNVYPKIDPIFSSYLEKRLGKRRLPDEPIEKKHQDIAWCLQNRLEEAVFHLLNRFNLGVSSNLCLAGGVAFNCAANGKISDNTPIRKIYIPPAAGDAGLAVGAAYYLWNHISGKPRSFVMDHAYWGESFTDGEIEKELAARANELKDSGCSIENIHDEDELCGRTARYISDGKVVGWFQGRMEFGPRALGNRSIVADPRREDMKDILNRRIKHRETFRPFAPSILEEDTAEYFENSSPSPFMLFARKVRENRKGLIPAVMHVDGTARLQTVNKNMNPLYWKLINEFKKITGLPVLLNTSFNENEPIICSPRQAIDCFLRTKIDVLVVEKFFIMKG